MVRDLKQRLLLLTPDELGTWRVDFDAFARTCTPPWPEILQQGGSNHEAVVRVVYSQDNYFLGCFQDEAKWHCVLITSADLDVPVYGYVLRDSPQSVALQRAQRLVERRAAILSQEAVPNAAAPNPPKILPRAVLRIRRPEGADHRQFEVVRVLAEDWILTDRPFDGIEE